VRVNSLFKKLIIVVLIFAVAAISFATFFIMKTQEQKIILEKETAEIKQEIQETAQAYLSLEKTQSLLKDSNLNNFSQALIKISGLEAVEIYDTNGTVLFSENKQNINQNFINDNNVKKALDGEAVVKKEDDFLLTYYVPIQRSDNSVKTVVSGKLSLKESTKQLDEFLYLTIIASSIMSALIIVVAFVVFKNAEESVTQKDRLLVEKTKALEEGQQQDEAILSSIAESLIVINKDGQIIYFNPEAERISGFKLSDVEFRLYKNFLIFTDKEGHEQKNNPITETIKTASKIQINIKDGYYLKQGKKNLIPVSVSVAPILDKDKKIKGVAATIRDITTEKELDKVKDEFVYVVAHELGNPIFALDGYLSILESQLAKKDKKNHEVLALAQNVKSQLSNLVNDLLEVVRNEQGTLTCETAPIDLGAIAKLVVQNAQFKAKSKKIKLSYEAVKIPKVIGNEQKITEVLTNFVDNAIKYTPDGGKISVFHELSAEGVETHIQDNGFGISKEGTEHLFEKFYRVKTKDTSEITGTGLGLFICKQIVEKCGGMVWATSEEGKGSTFSFSLKTAK